MIPIRISFLIPMTYFESHLPRNGCTGTWPDYLVNRDEKNEGQSGGKNSQKSRNSCSVNGRDCGYTGTFHSKYNFAQS